MGSTLVGLGACAVAAVFFGSVFVPIKKHYAGNGFFVQWVMASGILIIGMIVNALEGFPQFEPLAMLGGVFWSLGNSTAVPIMKHLGMGLGMLVWGITNVITGWACGTFGLFGTQAHPPSSVFFNSLGLTFVICGGVMFSQVRPSPRQAHEEDSGYTPAAIPVDDEEFRARLIEEEDPPRLHEDEDEERALIRGAAEGRSRQRERVAAFGVALIAGVLYGLTFMPVVYIQDNPEEFPTSSKAGLPYVFSHYCGIFLTSTAILVVYIAGTVNDPFVNNKIVGPSLAAGLMWGIAQSAWFVANENLSQAVSFPIIGMLPGALSALWSVFYFQEIRGARNLRLLTIAIALTAAGALFVGLSK